MEFGLKFSADQLVREYLLNVLTLYCCIGFSTDLLGF